MAVYHFTNLCPIPSMHNITSCLPLFFSSLSRFLNQLYFMNKIQHISYWRDSDCFKNNNFGNLYLPHTCLGVITVSKNSKASTDVFSLTTIFKFDLYPNLRWSVSNLTMFSLIYLRVLKFIFVRIGKLYNLKSQNAFIESKLSCWLTVITGLHRMSGIRNKMVLKILRLEAALVQF